MNLFAWTILALAALFVLWPLLRKENRIKGVLIRGGVVAAIMLAGVIGVAVLGMSFPGGIVIGCVIAILLDRKTYTKNRLIVYGAGIVLFAVSAFLFLRDNPAYVLKHLEKNPDSSSFYLSQNGKPLVSYQSDAVRPLASTVKIAIAYEYANQVAAGRVDPEQPVPLKELERFYIERTDGGAHEAWLEEMEKEGKADNGEVSLQEVAKGMVKFSSNANTDYLTGLLGAGSINESIQSLGLTNHEEIYPIVGALFISDEVRRAGMKDKQLIQELEKMPMDRYRSLAFEFGEKLAEGELERPEALPLDVQKVWSDRLPGATAAEYGRLMSAVSKDEFPPAVNETMRELLEWPMEFNPGNKERFRHLGMKGGSTAFILNQAMYAETLEGKKFEIVVLTDELNRMESRLLGKNMNSFLSKMIGSEEFRKEAEKRLGAAKE